MSARTASAPARTGAARKTALGDAQAESTTHLRDTRCEAALVGAAFFSEDAARLLSETPVVAFTDPTCSTLAEGMQDLTGRGLPIDEVTLASWLKDRDRWDAVGGYVALADLSIQLPDASRASVYRARVLDMYARRLAVEAAQTGNWQRVQRIAERALEVAGGAV